MNTLATLLLIVTLVVVFFGPRRWAFAAIMAGVIYLPQGSNFDLLGVSMFPHRIIEMVAFLRVIMRGEYSFSRRNRLDTTLLLLYGYTTIVFLLRSNRDLAYQTGTAVDALLCYLSFRGLTQTLEDFVWFLRVFAVLLMPFTALVLVESFTSHNPFEIVGSFTNDAFRNGRIRCIGTFRHSSLLGTLGGCFLPLYIGLWFDKNARKLAFVGMSCCMAIIWASNSGAPIGLVAVGLIGWMLWPMRTKMYVIRRSLTTGVILLAVLMKAPIWYLIERVSNISGGDGYHRAHLMDMAFQDLGKWWFAGMSLAETASWFEYHMGDGADMTNHFLNFGISAGLMALVLFILLLTRVCSSVGQYMAAVRDDKSSGREKEFLLWGLAVVVAVHIFNWLGIIYFDQTYVVWFMQLAVISTLTQGTQTNPVKTKERIRGSRAANLTSVRMGT